MKGHFDDNIITAQPVSSGEALHLFILMKIQLVRYYLEYLVLLCVFISGQIIKMTIVYPQPPGFTIHQCGMGRKETLLDICLQEITYESSVLYGSLPFLSGKLCAH